MEIADRRLEMAECRGQKGRRADAFYSKGKIADLPTMVAA